MDALTATATAYGLGLLNSNLKNTASKYALIGADTHNAETTGVFYTANIETSFYDTNGVLTFVVELPIETDFNKYLYAIAILDTTEQIVINTPTPKIALAQGIGGMMTIKAAVTGEAGSVIFKASDYVTNSELQNNYIAALNAKTQPATETNLGITRFATTSEAVNGQGGDVAIKPYQLFRIIDANVQNLNTSIAQKTTYWQSHHALPTDDIGPIWSSLYNGWMTWQEYNLNGANYAGYASVDIGQIFAGTQATARPGYVSFGMNIPIATHPALYHRAKHLGQLKTPAQWQPNTIAYRDNADGSFTVPDLRGMHQRFVGGSANGVNQSRLFGSYEADGLKKHAHPFYVFSSFVGLGNDGSQYDNGAKLQELGLGNLHGHNRYGAATSLIGINENRVKNTAFWGEIKL